MDYKMDRKLPDVTVYCDVTRIANSRYFCCFAIVSYLFCIFFYICSYEICDAFFHGLVLEIFAKIDWEYS
jgi:hypothetical protein